MVDKLDLILYHLFYKLNLMILKSKKGPIVMNNGKTQKKNKELDALKGIGIAGIVLFHIFPSVFPGGFLGVPLFFVLSGYFMYISSDESWNQGTFRIAGYYKKRIQKIFPPLFFMVMAVCCCLTLTKSPLLAGMREEICSIFLGYDNWWLIKQNSSYFSRLANVSPFTHLWFLAIEIQFYLFWPFLFILYKKCCQKISGRKMCFCFLFLAILSAGKMFFLYIPGEDPSRVYYGTDTMAFSLFLGMFLGASRQQFKALSAPESKNTFVPFAIFVLALSILFLTVNGENRFLYQGGMFLISLSDAAVINLIENGRRDGRTPISTSLLSFLGAKSYHIYLWHYPVILLTLMQFK